MGRKFSGLIEPPLQHIAHNAAHLEGHWNGPLTNLVGWLGDSASCPVKTVLIPVHAAWMPDVPGAVWGQVVQGSSPRESAVKQGEQWVKSFLQAHGLQKGSTVELASDRKDGDLRTRVVVWGSDLPPVFHRRYTVAKCPDPVLQETVAAAVVKAAVMVGASVDALTMVSARGMGSVDMQMLETEEILKPVGDTERWWKSGLEDMTRAQDQLVAALGEVPSSHDCYEEIQGWIYTCRVGTAPTDELTEGMQSMCRDFSDVALRSVPFSHRVQPPVGGEP